MMCFFLEKNHFRTNTTRSTKRGSSERGYSLTSVAEMIPKAKKKIIEKTLKKAYVLNFTRLLMATVLSEGKSILRCRKPIKYQQVVMIF